MSTDHSSTAEQGRLRAWREELATLIEPVFGKALNGHDDGLRIEFDGQALRVLETRASDGFALGEISAGESDAGRRLREITARSGSRGHRDAVAVLSGTEVLRPTVRLPRTSHRNLQRALVYELERLSPVSPEDVYFDFSVLGHESNTTDIELRIIRRDIVDRAIALCRDAGLAISEILFLGDSKPADWRTFPIDRTALLRARARRWNVALLMGLAAFLLVAILVAAYLRGAAVSDDLADEISNEGIRATQVERLHHRIDQATTQLAFLEKQKRAPLFIAILNDVTRALPDGTWITELDITGNKIRIEGYSHAASDLIGAFDRSGRFTNAQFAAPVTQGTAAGVERFDLTFEFTSVRS